MDKWRLIISLQVHIQVDSHEGLEGHNQCWLPRNCLVWILQIFLALTTIIPFKPPQHIPFFLPSFNSVCLENSFPSEKENLIFHGVALCSPLPGNLSC